MYRFLLCCLLTVIISSTAALAQNTSYVFQEGPLNETTSWQDDAGDYPESFTADNQEFIISGEAETDGDWTVGGEETVLVIDTDADITFAQDYTVTLDDITVSFTENGGGLLVAKGDLVLSGDLTWEYDDPARVWSFDYRENGDQTISAGSGAHFLVYNFRSEKVTGEFNLAALSENNNGNQDDTTVLQTLNNFRTEYRNEAMFRDHGNTFVVGDDIRLRGESARYELTGTLEHRVYDGNSDYEYVIPDLNHLHIIARNDGNPRFRDDEVYTQSVTVNGDMTIDMESEGDFDFNDVLLSIGGDFTITHHRGPVDGRFGEIDMDDAEISVAGDMIVSVSKDEPDFDENIDADDAVITVGGNLYINAVDNGEFDFDASSFTVQGNSEWIMNSGGIIDLDESDVTIEGNLDIDANSVEDLEFGIAVLTVGNNMELTHHRPEGANGEGEVDMDESTVTVGNDLIIRLSKATADGDENIDVDDSEITVGGNLYVFAEDNGEFDFDDATITVGGEYARFQASGSGILDMDNGTLYAAGDVEILVDATSELDLDDAVFELEGSLELTADQASILEIDEFIARFVGENDQSVSGLAGLPYYQLIIEKDDGEATLEGDVTAEDLFRASVTGDAVFHDAGYTIEAGNLAAFQGADENVSLDGTLLLSANNGSSGAEKTPGSTPAEEHTEGIITFDYEQLTAADVAFELFILPQMSTDPVGPAGQFTLSEENETASAELNFDLESPVFLFRQVQQQESGPVAITNLAWVLTDDTSAPVTETEIPDDFRLEQNYPNPFNPDTRIEYAIPETAGVTLEVFSVEGRRIAVLQDGVQDAGVHTVEFDATSLSSGTYIYRLQAGDVTLTRSMMLLK